MNIAVVFAAGVNRRDSLGQNVEHVQGLKCGEALVGLRVQKLAELIALHQFTDHHDHLFTANDGRFLVVILHEDRAVSQGV